MKEEKTFEVKFENPKGLNLNEILNKKPLNLKVGNINEVKDFQIALKDKKIGNFGEIKIHKDPAVNKTLNEWVNVIKKK